MPDRSVQLRENPLGSQAELHKLKDRRFLESLREGDYWSNYYQDAICRRNSSGLRRGPSWLIGITFCQPL